MNDKSRGTEPEPDRGQWRAKMPVNLAQTGHRNARRPMLMCWSVEKKPRRESISSAARLEQKRQQQATGFGKTPRSVPGTGRETAGGPHMHQISRHIHSSINLSVSDLLHSLSNYIPIPSRSFYCENHDEISASRDKLSTTQSRNQWITWGGNTMSGYSSRLLLFGTKSTVSSWKTQQEITTYLLTYTDKVEMIHGGKKVMY